MLFLVPASAIRELEEGHLGLQGPGVWEVGVSHTQPGHVASATLLPDTRVIHKGKRTNIRRLWCVDTGLGAHLFFTKWKWVSPLVREGSRGPERWWPAQGPLTRWHCLSYIMFHLVREMEPCFGLASPLSSPPALEAMMND